MKYRHNLQVQYLPLAGIKPDPCNARTHSKKQVGQIAASIAAFGFTNPLLIDEDGALIAGHGRLAAARKLGLDKVPVIELSGLSEPEKRALRLADNKIAQNAGWDGELLKIELESLAKVDLGFSLDITGFSSGEIDVTLGQGKVDPDDEVVPAVPAQARTRSGDIWQLGEHRVGCGDCRDSGFLQALLGLGIQADAAFRTRRTT
jgi:ParB-like chromosome segregation protein Spo0J